MACECGCGCCGPLRQDGEVQRSAELEEQKGEAARRAEELQGRIADVDSAAR